MLPESAVRLLGLGIFHEFDDVADALQLLGLFIRDFVSEFLFESHDQLDGIERISAKIFDELGLRGDLVRVDAELFDDDIFTRCSIVFSAMGFSVFNLGCLYATSFRGVKS